MRARPTGPSVVGTVQRHLRRRRSTRRAGCWSGRPGVISLRRSTFRVQTRFDEPCHRRHHAQLRECRHRRLADGRQPLDGPPLDHRRRTARPQAAEPVGCVLLWPISRRSVSRCVRIAAGHTAASPGRADRMDGHLRDHAVAGASPVSHPDAENRL
jgi:hypothetical protein